MTSIKYPLILSNACISVPTLRDVLIQIFPDWSVSEITIKKLTGGITNMLLQCQHKNQTVLVRTYGKKTDLIINRNQEFKNFLYLNKLNLSSKVYAKLSNGLIYGFLDGRSLVPDELTNFFLYPLISQKLAYFHYKTRNFPKKDRPKDIYLTIKDWIDLLSSPEKIASTEINNDDTNSESDYVKFFMENSILNNKNLLQNKNSNNLKEILIDELNWFMSIVENKSREVISHSDLLSGNVVINENLSHLYSENHQFLDNDNNTNTINTANSKIIKNKQKFNLKDKNSIYNISFNSNLKIDNIILSNANNDLISFIDYEYMSTAPRGFDISNHLIEWQGFDCEISRIPNPIKTNQTLRRWCISYILGYLNINFNNPNIDNRILNKLLDEFYPKNENFFDQLNSKQNDQNNNKPNIKNTNSFSNGTKINLSDQTFDTDFNIINKNVNSIIDQLIEEIYYFYGLPGFYWGIWAIIQHSISTIDFDYLNYSVNRFNEYWIWKKNFINNSQTYEDNYSFNVLNN
ncbi:kinase-like protein [Ascoidea rubescens DSM 1968]|uniref:ethanolamine kinase n=1 Tax=Ascoidea rubescens DSM 1968 TaxID=1344418 RepID=A0A1D2VP48_9ASCO|nr:kinase-like protein [Ascoidea rubescens DSM 1968]ODV63378.1 kinase-like protein [Ascoidea rubescens DSM 1968]